MLPSRLAGQAATVSLALLVGSLFPATGLLAQTKRVSARTRRSVDHSLVRSLTSKRTSSLPRLEPTFVPDWPPWGALAPDRCHLQQDTLQYAQSVLSGVLAECQAKLGTLPGELLGFFSPKGGWAELQMSFSTATGLSGAVMSKSTECLVEGFVKNALPEHEQRKWFDRIAAYKEAKQLGSLLATPGKIYQEMSYDVSKLKGLGKDLLAVPGSVGTLGKVARELPVFGTLMRDYWDAKGASGALASCRLEDAKSYADTMLAVAQLGVKDARSAVVAAEQEAYCTLANRGERWRAASVGPGGHVNLQTERMIAGLDGINEAQKQALETLRDVRWLLEDEFDQQYKERYEHRKALEARLRSLVDKLALAERSCDPKLAGGIAGELTNIENDPCYRSALEHGFGTGPVGIQTRLDQARRIEQGDEMHRKQVEGSFLAIGKEVEGLIAKCDLAKAQAIYDNGVDYVRHLLAIDGESTCLYDAGKLGLKIDERHREIERAKSTIREALNEAGQRILECQEWETEMATAWARNVLDELACPAAHASIADLESQLKLLERGWRTLIEDEVFNAVERVEITIRKHRAEITQKITAANQMSSPERCRLLNQAEESIALLGGLEENTSCRSQRVLQAFEGLDAQVAAWRDELDVARNDGADELRRLVERGKILLEGCEMQPLEDLLAEIDAAPGSCSFDATIDRQMLDLDGFLIIDRAARIKTRIDIGNTYLRTLENAASFDPNSSAEAIQRAIDDGNGWITTADRLTLSDESPDSCYEDLLRDLDPLASKIANAIAALGARPNGKERGSTGGHDEGTEDGEDEETEWQAPNRTGATTEPERNTDGKDPGTWQAPVRHDADSRSVLKDVDRSISLCRFDEAYVGLARLEQLGGAGARAAVARRPEIDRLVADRRRLEAALRDLSGVLASENMEQIRPVLNRVIGLSTCSSDLHRLRNAVAELQAATEAQAEQNRSKMRRGIDSGQRAQAISKARWARAATSLTVILHEVERANRAAADSSRGVGAPGVGSDGTAQGSQAKKPTCVVEREALAMSSLPGHSYFLLESSNSLQGYSYRAYGIRAVQGSRIPGAIGPFDTLAAARAEMDRRCPPSERSIGSIRFQ